MHTVQKCYSRLNMIIQSSFDKIQNLWRYRINSTYFLKIQFYSQDLRPAWFNVFPKNILPTLVIPSRDSRPQTKTSEDDNQKRSQLLRIRLYDLQPSNSLVPWVSVKFKRKRLISYMQLLVNVVVEIFDDKLSCSYNNRESQNHVIKGMTHA